MIIQIKRVFTFESAHFLPHVAEDHKCRNLHGHNFKTEIYFSGNIDPKYGWLCDFADIDQFWDKYIKSLVDHKLLNDIAGLENPTSEMLSHWIYSKFRENKKFCKILSHVTVYENDRCSATYGLSL